MCVDLQADSGFFCEGYSSDEDVILKEEFRGAIVKQGCLLKQVRTEQTHDDLVIVIRPEIRRVSLTKPVISSICFNPKFD